MKWIRKKTNSWEEARRDRQLSRRTTWVPISQHKQTLLPRNWAAMRGSELSKMPLSLEHTHEPAMPERGWSRQKI